MPVNTPGEINFIARLFCMLVGRNTAIKTQDHKSVH